VRIVDANTGRDLRVGVPFTNLHGRKLIIEVEEGPLRARARVRRIPPSGPGPAIYHESWVPLSVRYTHPRFFLQKVAFFPS
jgi:hypothetical protein